MTLNPYSDDPWSKILRVVVVDRIDQEDRILRAMDLCLHIPTDPTPKVAQRGDQEAL